MERGATRPDCAPPRCGGVAAAGLLALLNSSSLAQSLTRLAMYSSIAITSAAVPGRYAASSACTASRLIVLTSVMPASGWAGSVLIALISSLPAIRPVCESLCLCLFPLWAYVPNGSSGASPLGQIPDVAFRGIPRTADRRRHPPPRPPCRRDPFLRAARRLSARRGGPRRSVGRGVINDSRAADYIHLSFRLAFFTIRLSSLFASSSAMACSPLLTIKKP
jgi:hypothetical protein